MEDEQGSSIIEKRSIEIWLQNQTMFCSFHLAQIGNKMKSENFKENHLLEFTYDAVLCQQTRNGKPTLLFSAPCVDIEQWAGVPRKSGLKTTDLDEVETIGFQRGGDDKRIKDFSLFYEEEKNTVQNPILCAARYLGENIEFIPIDQSTSLGKVKIRTPDLTKLSLVEVIEKVKEYLESRCPELESRTPSETLIKTFISQLRNIGLYEDQETDEANEFDELEQDQEFDQEYDELVPDEFISDDATQALFADDHIEDFWEQLAARLKAIDSKNGLRESLSDRREILGLKKKDLIGYLTPAILVDGQHRTLAATQAFERYCECDEVKSHIEDLVKQGKDDDDIRTELTKHYARRLNISLLLDDSPAEHVFQFVIVNQKASPISKVLLGTIVSTTLTEQELSNVSTRLESANIPVGNSRIITKLIKDPSSPFHNKVKRGIGTDAKEMLDWAVFSRIVEIFYRLNNGTLYHESNDYAKSWRQQYLKQSGLNESDGDEASSFLKWQQGTWEIVFRKFWQKVREKFASADPESHAYWGSPIRSNLFNKISLTILASSFFEYLVSVGVTLESEEDLEQKINSWMEKVPGNYFDREWKLNGQKKDSTGIRRQWAKTWSEYRKVGGSLPSASKYGKSI